MRRTRSTTDPGLRFAAGPRRTSWYEVDYFAPSIARPSVHRFARRFITFTVVPSWVPPRRYALRWQLLQWAAVAVLVALLIAA